MNVGVPPEWRQMVGDDLMGGYATVVFRPKQTPERNEMEPIEEALAKARTEIVRLADENLELRRTIVRLEELLARTHAPNVEYVPHHPPITTGTALLPLNRNATVDL